MIGLERVSETLRPWLGDELIRRIRIPLLREDAELLVGLIRCFHLPMGSAER